MKHRRLYVPFETTPSTPHAKQSYPSTGVTFFTTLAGTPIATLQAGISFVTTAPAAIVQPCPIVTPGKITTCPPIQQSSPITTFLAYSIFSRRLWTSVSCVAFMMETLGPSRTVLPMVTRPQSRTVKLKFAKKLLCDETRVSCQLFWNVQVGYV
jgi:hypothetical protein